MIDTYQMHAYHLTVLDSTNHKKYQACGAEGAAQEYL